MQNCRLYKPFRALTLSSVLLLGACAQDQSPTEQVEKARQHLADKSFSAASIELSNALQQDPQNRDARWLLAKTSLELGEWQKAERDALLAMGLGIPRAEALPVLARALLQQSDTDRLLTETSTLPNDASKSTQATLLSLRGAALLLKNDANEARIQFERAQGLDPDNPDVLLGMAQLHVLRADFEPARALLEKTLAQTPDLADGWSLLGDLELEQGNFEAAENAYDKAISTRTYRSLELARRAHARLQQGKFELAETDLDALSRQAGHPYVAYLRGLLYFNQQKFNEAAVAFETSITEAPAYLPSRLYLATTRLMLNQPEQALTHAEFIRSAAPGTREANVLVGLAEISKGEFAAARSALVAALKGKPDDTITLQMLASAALLEGDVPSGLDYAERLAILQPDSRSVVSLLMLAQLMAGAAVPDLPPGKADEYQSAFILALQAFRDDHFDDARARVKTLRSAYPDQIDPLGLDAAIDLATGQWPQARIKLQKVLDQQPTNRSARLNMAKLELNVHNYERVRELVGPVVHSSPTDEASALLLVAAEHALGNAEAANLTLEKLIKANPAADTARALLARRHLNVDAPGKALEVLRNLSDAQLAANPLFLELRGSASLAKNDATAARATFEHLVRVAPESARARFMLSESLLHAGQFLSAQRALDEALKLDPRYLPARIGEVRFLTHAKLFDKAAAAAKKLLQDFGELPEVLATTGWHALVTSDFVAAENNLNRAFAKTPNTALALELVRAQWGQQKYEAALSGLNTWIDAHPDDLAALLHLAGAHLSLGQEAEAVAAYQRVLKLEPDHIPSINNIAWLSRAQNPDEALRMARRALELAPEDPHVLDTLGMLYFERKDFAQAARFVTEASKASPQDMQIALNLARVQIAQGKTKDARETLGAVLKEGGGSPVAEHARKLVAELDARN